MIEAAGASPTLGPNGFAYLEHALAVLARTRADGRTKLEAVGVFGGLVRLLAAQERDARLAEAADPSKVPLADHLAELAASGAHPHLAAAMADAHVPGDQFERVVRRVVVGLVTGPA